MNFNIFGNDFFTKKRVEILKMRCWTLRSYRLPVEMLYRGKRSKKIHDFRKEELKKGLFVSPTKSEDYAIDEVEESSSPGEFHPQALTDPDVTVSRHPALIVQPQ